MNSFMLRKNSTNWCKKTGTLAMPAAETMETERVCKIHGFLYELKNSGRCGTKQTLGSKILQNTYQINMHGVQQKHL